jgi:hypothetical protein
MVGVNLNGDVAVQARVVCAVHFAHAASADERKDLSIAGRY